jgi:hypothetical protein
MKAQIAVAALAVGIAALWSSPSNALTFDFSFDGGAVTGEIDGLFANGTNEAATHVYVDSYPAFLLLSLSTPFDMVPDVKLSNSFSVNAAGEITAVLSSRLAVFGGRGMSFNI